jgi:hypothetical protein
LLVRLETWDGHKSDLDFDISGMQAAEQKLARLCSEAHREVLWTAHREPAHCAARMAESVACVRRNGGNIGPGQSSTSQSPTSLAAATAVRD